MWNVRGRKRLTIHDDPPLVVARQEFLSWLAEVPEPPQTAWRQRLESDLDHPHLSVRLELYLHHYFKSECWAVDIEPEMPRSPNKPDFRVMRGTDTIFVEAKAILDEQLITRETQRLRQVADNLGGKLSRDVIIKPLSDLPPSLPAGRIKAQIEQRAKTQVDEVLEFDLSDMHQGTPYSLKIIILTRASDSPEPGEVVGIISGVRKLAIGKRIRDALEQKAGKYGSIDMPFFIAVYGNLQFPIRTRHELDALFGDKELLCPTTGMGAVTVRRKPNGFFTSVREGKRRHEQVSAVLFYRFKWLNNGHEHRMHIYHNPFALMPLTPDLFPGVPQMVLNDGGTMKWINGEPE
ncbi:MAG: hypothetical protein M1136_11830 [Chloroflexi bacterium]|nr:hypothetical protein [Chloroflexota bacterium]MCL5076311.1 hypothetical protein [Chloroflexota bacterium]